MVRGTYAKGLVLLAVVFSATSGECAPTLNFRDNTAEGRDSEVLSSADTVCVTYISDTTGQTESYLAAVSPEFHNPTVRYSNRAAQGKAIKSLPPAPSTFVLALLGFLFVTAVKDRRLWLAGIASVLCAGQGGFALLPQLASHLDARGRCFSGLFHAHGSAMVRLLAESGDTESPASFDPVVAQARGYDGACTRRFAGILRSRSSGGGGDDHAPAKRKVFQAATPFGLCCLDYDVVICGQQARRFPFLSHNGVNSRLARGPPR